MRSFLLFLLALFVAAPAFAGVDGPDIPSVEGKGVVAEPGVDSDGTIGSGAGTPFVGIPVFFEADDTAAYTGPTGATLDTGDEVCAVFGLSCATVFTLNSAGASGDEITDAQVACTTDNADGVYGLAICY